MRSQTRALARGAFRCNGADPHPPVTPTRIDPPNNHPGKGAGERHPLDPRPTTSGTTIPDLQPESFRDTDGTPVPSAQHPASSQDSPLLSFR